MRYDDINLIDTCHHLEEPDISIFVTNIQLKQLQELVRILNDSRRLHNCLRRCYMLRENQLPRLWNVFIFLKPLRHVLDTLKQTTTVCIYMQSHIPILVISLCEVRYSFYNLLIEIKKTYKNWISTLDLKLVIINIITNTPVLSEKNKAVTIRCTACGLWRRQLRFIRWKI